MEKNILIDKNKKFTEKDFDILLRYQNSKLHIYQYTNEPVIRPKIITQEYDGSFEQKQILNKSTKILNTASNTITKSIEENKNFNYIKHNLKKNFTRKNITGNDYEINTLQYKHSEFLKSKKYEELLNDEEFKQLCLFIESSDFDYNMRKSKNIARWVLSHEYLKYHAKGDEIKEKYLRVLCPNYVFNENNNDNILYEYNDFSESVSNLNDDDNNNNTEEQNQNENGEMDCD